MGQFYWPKVGQNKWPLTSIKAFPENPAKSCGNALGNCSRRGKTYDKINLTSLKQSLGDRCNHYSFPCCWRCMAQEMGLMLKGQQGLSNALVLPSAEFHHEGRPILVITDSTARSCPRSFVLLSRDSTYCSFTALRSAGYLL